MRILVLGINYWPEETGIAVFNTERCEYLAGRGHEVTMCTAVPYYPGWRVSPQYRWRPFSREVRNGVTILRSYLYVPRRVTTARRVIHEASFIGVSWLRALLWSCRPDVLFVVSPPLGLGVSAVLLGRLWKIPHVFHVEDLQPDAALDLGMLPSGRLMRGLYAVERLAYRHAALVSTLTDSMLGRIVAKGIDERKVALLSPWAEPGLFTVPPAGGGEEVRRSFGLEGRFLAVHVGNMGVKQGLDVALEAAGRCREHPEITYLLVGDGAVRPVLEARARALSLSNVRFLPVQPRKVFLELLAAADVCLVTQLRAVADIVFPSKVVTLLSAGRPVIASVNPRSEVARVVREAGAGLVVPPEDPQALLNAILALRDASEDRRTMGQRGRAYARDHWDREKVLAEMEERLIEVAGTGVRSSGSRSAAESEAPFTVSCRS